MEAFLDLRTLSVNNILVSLSFGICLLLYSNQYPQLKGIKTSGYAFIISSTAFLLIGFRNYIPDFFSIIIPNGLLVLSMALVHLGFALFYELDTKDIKRLHSFMLVTILISAFIFTYVDLDTNIRIVNISFIISLQCVFIMRTLLTAYETNHHRANLLIAVSFIFFASFFAFRGLITLSEEPLMDFMNAGLMHSLSIIVYQFVVIFTSFGLMWMVSHKIHNILKDQATHDPLTKVFNRRALEEIISVESARSLRNETPLAVVMLDIDFFKRLNDRYGHCTGDEVLILIANLLVSNTRPYDSIARFGGEEFIMLLPSTDLDKGKMIAEKLRSIIENYDYQIKDNRNVQITASFGVTSCDLSKESWLNVLDRCDRALYLAKESGRNKVIVFSDDSLGKNQDAVDASTG